jgi:hypothetical protein
LLYRVSADPRRVVHKMRSGLRRRIVNLERTCRITHEVQGPVTTRSFLAQVEERIQVSRQSFQEATGRTGGSDDPT